MLCFGSYALLHIIIEAVQEGPLHSGPRVPLCVLRDSPV